MERRVGCPKNVHEWWWLCQVVSVHLLLRALVPFVRLDRLLRWLAPKRISATQGVLAFETLDRFSNGLFRRFPSHPRGDCLIRSLVRFFLAQRYGVPVRFHCGVRRAGEALVGHAWLSLDGKPFKDANNPFQDFTLTFTYPPIPSRNSDIEDSAGSLDTYLNEPVVEKPGSR